MINIFVGDVYEDLCALSKKHKVDITLITSDNFYNLQPGNYYVSLGDLKNLEEFKQTLQQADHLTYCATKKWSDEKDNLSYMKIWTEYYLLVFQEKIDLVSKSVLTPTDILKSMLTLEDNRKTTDPQLWIAGCSISHGTGIQADQRYGQLLANQMKKQVSFLTKSSSSIQWAADQILRSDIRQNDIVVWGLTSFNRFPYYSNQKVHHVGVTYYKKHPEFDKIISLERLDDENRIYVNLCYINSVINFCNKIHAKLLIAGLMSDHTQISWLQGCQYFFPIFGKLGINREDMYLDFGSDNLHPGPNTHEWYAKEILKAINV